MSNNAKDILIDRRMELPIQPNKNNKYFPSYVSVILNDYIELLEEYNFDNSIITRISDFRDNIFNSLESYYGGDQCGAYEFFKDAMLAIDPSQEHLIITLNENEFYRARISNNDNDFDKNQMFHVPFEMRTKISTQRYSFPGLPCLYLGGSTFTCWNEIGKPSYDNLNIALIKTKPNEVIKVVDLCQTPQFILQEYQKTNNTVLLINYIRIWPLIAVCSFCVTDEYGFFKPEYIIPQMLLQWLMKEIDILRPNWNVKGIRYFSVKPNNAGNVKNQLFLNYNRLYTNYVFPIIISKTKGHCEILEQMFEVYSTISGKTASMALPQRNTGVFYGDNPPEEDITSEYSEYIVLPDGQKTLYSQSIFDWIEKILKADQTISSLDGDLFFQT